MHHIQETTDTYPFLYYQRILIKGYISLNLPVIMAIKSTLGDGYIYLRQHLKGIRIRDFDNTLQIDPTRPARPLVARDPTRGLLLNETVTMDVRVRGRSEAMAWAYTKDDQPRIANTETYTEFLACMPLRDHSVPNFNLVTDYFGSFIDWYRIITGDVSMTGPEHWNSHVPIYSQCTMDIRAHRGRPIDEIVIDINPNGFTPLMFHTDVEPNETGTTRTQDGDLTHEQRIAHYLAIGHSLPSVHRRFADVLHLAQETKDWALVALCMYPVFEQYLDDFLTEVATRSSGFKTILERKRAKDDVIYVGQRIKWLPNALRRLGFDPSSVGSYFEDLEAANSERVQVVHCNKKPTFQEAANFTRILTNTVFLCETVLERDPPYVVAVKRLD